MGSRGIIKLLGLERTEFVFGGRCFDREVGVEKCEERVVKMRDGIFPKQTEYPTTVGLAGSVATAYNGFRHCVTYKVQTA